MSFKEGWYRTRVDHQRRRFYRYYISPDRYISECFTEPNGQQILLWSTESEAGARVDPVSAEWAWSPPARNDWWDNPAGSQNARLDTPGDHARASRKPTARELAQRAGQACISDADGLSCTKEIHVGIFFDGTNNNMERDKPDDGHSNVVSLFEAHKDDRSTHFAYYIPGVGTRFPEIGELGESADGKAFAAGGENRIHWAMLLVYNAISRAVMNEDLLQKAEMQLIVTRTLATVWRTSSNRRGEIITRLCFDGLQKRLLAKLGQRRPRVIRVNLSVFGFSRGAAEARTFCTWLEQVTRGRIAHADLRLRFLGLFDTVASVGLADSSPIGDGLMDWADDTLGVQWAERCVHFVASHEIRRSFPVSLARATDGSAVTGASEYAYPGAHSDIGGGYCPGDQGKSVGARSKLLAQVPLMDMYFHALNAGVALYTKDKMRPAIKRDFEIHPELDSAFSAYVRWTSMDEKGEDVAQQPKAIVVNRMQRHMQYYWRWRGSKDSDAKFKAMACYQAANAQDRNDLWEAELDWRSDVLAAREAVKKQWHNSSRNLIPAGQNRIDLVAELANTGSVPPEVDVFFDRYVHDSHAGFWLLGPQTKYDKKVFVEEIRRKKRVYDQAMEIVMDPRMVRHHERAIAQANFYRLNRFEQQLIEMNVNAKNEGEFRFPLLTDKDAEEMRENAGFITATTLRLVLGTATRREASGHGQYRRVFAKG